MMHEAVFRIEGDGMDLIHRSLKPEESEGSGFRSRTELVLENARTLVLHVWAGDIPALRAALNMWLRLVKVAEDMQEIVKHG